MKKLLILLTFICLCSNVYAQDFRNQFTQNKSVIYVINIRSFNSKDTNKNGTIELEKGEESGTFTNATERLDEIKSLGINTIHVLPVTKVGKKHAIGTAGSLYAMASFTEFDRLLDDHTNDLDVKEEAKIFIDEAHKKGIKVIFDMPACGSYDLFEEHPELFVTDKDKNPITPLDWSDVRLFKVQDENGALWQPLYDAYQSYIDILLDLGVDGVRCDVATNKSYEFWQKMIVHARSKNPDFLFLAEACEVWNKPLCPEAVYTPYDKLLEVGFDGYLGSLFSYKEGNKFVVSKYMTDTLCMMQKYPEKKTVLGGFASHDEKSPFLSGDNLGRQVLWMSATLPVVPYFVDGFDTAARYQAGYFNRKTKETYTDCDKYIVHQGQLDIFNLCAPNKGSNPEFQNEFKKALEFRQQHIDTINKGKIISIPSTSPMILAYAIKGCKETILLVYSTEVRHCEYANINLKKICRFKELTPITEEKAPTVTKGSVTLNFKPYETKVFVLK
jgi:glycosidase